MDHFLKMCNDITNANDFALNNLNNVQFSRVEFVLNIVTNFLNKYDPVLFITPSFDALLVEHEYQEFERNERKRDERCADLLELCTGFSDIMTKTKKRAVVSEFAIKQLVEMYGEILGYINEAKREGLCCPIHNQAMGSLYHEDIYRNRIIRAKNYYMALHIFVGTAQLFMSVLQMAQCVDGNDIMIDNIKKLFAQCIKNASIYKSITK